MPLIKFHRKAPQFPHNAGEVALFTDPKEVEYLTTSASREGRGPFGHVVTAEELAVQERAGGPERQAHTSKRAGG